MMTTPDISFIIVNFNGLEDTLELLGTLRTFCKSISHEVIVVDNGSSADESLLLRCSFDEYKFIRSEINLGFAGGNNLGISESKGRYIFLLNNDTLLVDTSISGVIDFLDRNPDAGAVSPRLLFYNPMNFLQFAGFTELTKITLRNRGIGYNEKDTGQYNVPSRTAFTHGAAMIVRRKVYETIGLMPESYFLYYEEYDWCEQMKRAGFELWYYPGFKVIHKESRSTGKISNSKIYYLTRNRLIFARRNRIGLYKFLSVIYQICISGIVAILRQIASGNFQGAKAVLLGIIDFVKKKEGRWNR